MNIRKWAMSSASRVTTEERLKDAEKLIGYLVREHNECFVCIQASYTTQIDNLHRTYKTDFKE